MRIVPGESKVILETNARGLLAAAAHDLRIEAPVTEGESTDGVHCTARFDVSAMRVVASRRHGTTEFHEPNPRDVKDIEGRIRSEAFEGRSEVNVEATLADDGAHASITVRAQRSQTLNVPVRVERDGDTTKVHGRCELSLQALGTGKIHVPLGAIKVDDRVPVTFDILLR